MTDSIRFIRLLSL